MILAYQVLPSTGVFARYGIKRFAKVGRGQFVMSFIDGPCVLVKFI